jgi:hypothetical protein
MHDVIGNLADAMKGLEFVEHTARVQTKFATDTRLEVFDSCIIFLSGPWSSLGDARDLLQFIVLLVANSADI